MLEAYVGIATHRGLEALLPEQSTTSQASLRRAYRRPSGQAVCFWAVLPKDVAQEVEHQIQAGESLAALVILDRAARQLGPLLPTDVLLATRSDAPQGSSSSLNRGV